MPTSSSTYANAWLANGQSGATAFPPPMWGRDREGGTTSNGPCLRSETQSPHSRYLEPAQDLLRTVCFVATPLPVSPPHGGRERCGTHLRNSRLAQFAPP